jgi:RNA polymerase sigma-70 factor (ECF subfamily)
VREDGIPPALEPGGAGDGEAFAELFRRAAPRVARLCRRMLGPGALAEDAESEVFLRARRGFETFDRERPFAPWVLRIAGNVCIDQLRRLRRERRLFEPAELDESGLADPGPTPLRHLSRRETRDEVLRAIDALPLRYRLPLVLRYWSELDYDAIADVLGVTRGQVGTLLFRAKRRLRASLPEREPEDER